MTLVVGAVLLIQDVGKAQRATALYLQPGSVNELRAWDASVTQLERSGELETLSVERDPALPTRTLERLQQLHNGVPVWGSNVVRDTDAGVAVSLFGALAPSTDIPTIPSLRPADVQTRLASPGATVVRQPSLVVLPMESGDFRLAYTAVISSESAVERVFVDAHDGSELLRYSEIQTQAAVGSGKGVLGDTKKVSAVYDAGAFWADDQLRPPVLKTFDMRGSLSRVLNVMGGAPLSAAERAVDTDNEWGDGVAVDAHAHVGWTYDYYFKRFSRRGLDNRDRPIVALINGLTRQNGASYSGTSFFGQFVTNASWCGSCGPNGVGVMYFGNGFSPGLYVPSGQNWGYLAGALDVIAHELTHGVIDSSSRLVYLNESGALNEAFADMMGTSVEFYYQPPGTGLRQADYLIGEDAVRGVTTTLHGIRSMNNPAMFGHPDHYSRRLLTSSDSGGVHTNSAIPNQAFYLAIEGGTNRTSRLSVQGVGAANREQIERVFYRAFVFLLPSNARFSTARAATIQAARDLYGAGSPAERAVTEAWSAVGVF